MNSVGKDHASWGGGPRGIARILWLALFAPGLMLAGREGLPVAHTGAFGEPSCDQAGCHRNTLGGNLSVAIEVGPYVPGAGPQPVSVTIVDPAAKSWGFQLAARRSSNPSVPAGTFEALNQFTRVRCADTALPPPCGSANTLQYVTHTDAGSRTGPASSKKFTFNWTAPGSDVGNIIFNVAALGADGDLGTNGDRTNTSQTVSLYAPSNTPLLNTNGAVNAAAPTGPGRSIAPGTLLSIFGQKLAAPNTFRVAGSNDLDPQSRIPTELNRISVEFTSPPNDLIPRLGRVLFVSDKQINLQAPDFFPATGDTVQIQAIINRGKGLNEIRSNVISSDIHRIAPALFTLNSSGTGDAAAVHANGQLVAATGKYAGSSPARPNEVILIFGNGFGATSPAVDAGELPSSPVPLAATPTVEIGGLVAEVFYAGVAPGFAGLYQFNVRIPPNGLPAGNHAVLMRAGNLISQPGVTITVGQ